MMIAMLLAASAALAGPPAPKDYPSRIDAIEKTMDGTAGDFLWIGTSSAADLFTTAWALHRCPSCYEGNPLGFSVESRVALKAGAAVLVTGGCYKLRRDGHHSSATALRWTFAIISFGLAANNAYHAIKQR